ncbi:hypothetical protein BJ166DRAFT_598730 [Pestalotiopsis sp. NC0098]|nr:hypothetical protein BJ166DRAFT_598730 [Pestalotiopsis sp. NC0098]
MSQTHQTGWAVPSSPIPSTLSDHITDLNAAYAYKHVQKGDKIGLEQWCHVNFLSKPMLDSLWRMRDRRKSRVEKRWPGGMNKGIKDIQNPMFIETIRKALVIGLVTQSAMLRSKSNSHITVNYNQPGLISSQSAVLYQGQDVSSATFTKRGAVFPAYRWIVYDKFESSNGKCTFNTVTVVHDGVTRGTIVGVNFGR